MKRATSLIGLVSLATMALVSARAEWRLLTLMRGEPETAVFRQRVAFVGSAVVKTVDGNAERLCGIDRWTPLPPGTHLQTGDIVRTGKGVVILKMNESESFVKVTPNTILRLIPLEK